MKKRNDVSITEVEVTRKPDNETQMCLIERGVDFTGALAGALSWLEDTRSTASLCFLVEGNTTEHFKKINRQKVQDSQARRSGHCHLDYWEKIFALLDTELPGRWFYMLEPLGGKGIFRCCYCGDTVSPHHARLLKVNRQVNHALSHVNHIQVSKLKSDVPDDPMLTKPDASIIPVDAPSLPNPPTKSQRGAFIFSVVECFALELPTKQKLRDPLSLPVPQQSATLTQAKAAKAAENAAARKVAQEKTAQRKEEAMNENEPLSD